MNENIEGENGGCDHQVCMWHNYSLVPSIVLFHQHLVYCITCQSEKRSGGLLIVQECMGFNHNCKMSTHAVSGIQCSY